MTQCRLNLALRPATEFGRRTPAMGDGVNYPQHSYTAVTLNRSRY